MKQFLCLLYLLIALAPSRAEEIAAKDGWSPAVNGLRARLSFGETKTYEGDPFPEVYLQLQNVSDLITAIEFEFDALKELHFALSTAEGKPFPNSDYNAASGVAFGPYHVTIPYGGTLKFPVTWGGWSFHRNFGTVLPFQSDIWEIPKADKNAYFLSLRMDIPAAPSALGRGAPWHGILEIPAVQAPTSSGSVSAGNDSQPPDAPDSTIRVACEVVKNSDAKLPPDILVSSANIGKLNTTLKMGIMLVNGATYLPTALKLLITDSTGVTRVYKSEGLGAFSGRIDPFAVPLPVGSTYRLLCPLDKFISTEIWERASSIGTGNFKVAAEIANPPAAGGVDHVEENGMLESRYWHGLARSEAVSLTLP